MMNPTFVTHYAEAPEFQLAQFTYKDNEVSMVVILLKKLDELADVENSGWRVAVSIYFGSVV